MKEITYFPQLKLNNLTGLRDIENKFQ